MSYSAHTGDCCQYCIFVTLKMWPLVYSRISESYLMNSLQSCLFYGGDSMAV